jgi:sarcosine oxidase subunit gamma
MVNLDKLRTSPLNSIQIGSESTVNIKEIAFLNMWDLRVAPASPAAAKVEKVLAIKLPLKVGETTASNISCLALGPDWWLLVGVKLSEIENLIQNTQNEFISLVNVSAQRTCLEVSGPAAKSVLQHAWEGDLDDQGLAVSACTQGLMARCPTIIHRVEKTTYRLYVRSSFAQHLYKFLADAATEYLK